MEDKNSDNEHKELVKKLVEEIHKNCMCDYIYLFGTTDEDDEK